MNGDDTALFWNDVLNDLNARDHTGAPASAEQGGPTRTSRAYAIVHLAIYDAYVLSGVLGAGKSSYLNYPASVPRGAPPRITASTAAAMLCEWLYPAQRNFIRMRVASAPPDAVANSLSSVVGAMIAQAFIAARAADLHFDERHPDAPDYVESPAYGHHRRDPVADPIPSLSPYWGRLPLFATQAAVALQPPPGMSATGQFDRTNPGFSVYLAHHQEVRRKGGHPALQTTSRAPVETLVGIYWAYDGVQKLGTPPRLYCRVIQLVLRKLALKPGGRALTENETVELFAFVGAALADAGIHAWYYKYKYDLWRPVVGIHELDMSVGPFPQPGLAVDPDVDLFWRPLGAPATNADRGKNFTPPFPAYPSGHATFGAAALHVTALYLKSLGLANINPGYIDDVAFDYVSEELDGQAVDADGSSRPKHRRAFVSLLQAIMENAISRVYLGVHWRFDGTLGGYRTNGMVTADYSPNPADITLAFDPNDSLTFIGGVPLGLQIAESIFNNGKLTRSGATLDPSGLPSTAAL